MKKNLNKAICSIVLTISIFCLNIVDSSAVSPGSGKEGNDQNLTLVKESQYYSPENDAFILERLFVSNTETLFKTGAAGSATFKKTKTEEFAGNPSVPIEYWVSGHFTWDQDKNTSTVTNVSSGIENNGWFKFENESTVSESNTGGQFFGDKYAYAKYSFTARHTVSSMADRNLSVYVDVNVKGVSKTA